jgi:hypothetical protein
MTSLPKESSMFAPVKTIGYRRALLARCAVALAAAAGLATLALGVVMAQTPVPKPGTRLAPSATTTAPAPNLVAYQLRCWQHGRLLLEEALTELPTEPLSQSIRLRGLPSANGRGSPYLIFSLGAATCLAKPAVEGVVSGV